MLAFVFKSSKKTGFSTILPQRISPTEEITHQQIVKASNNSITRELSGFDKKLKWFNYCYLKEGVVHQATMDKCANFLLTLMTEQ